jgi:hypothetical protein
MGLFMERSIGIFSLLFAALFVCSTGNSNLAQTGFSEQRTGLSFEYPKTYKDWPNGFLAGNGKMGIIVFGNPLDETVIFNDRKFYMAASDTSRERSFNQVSEADLKQIRDYCTNESW